MNSQEQKVILLFDGVCNFCNKWINFIIKHDKKNKFLFATLQSNAAKTLLKENNILEDQKSVVLIYNNKVHIKSTACLHACFHLGGLYALPFCFIILPAFVRDFYYDIVAKNRYKWWGKQESCMMPSPEIKKKFID